MELRKKGNDLMNLPFPHSTFFRSAQYHTHVHFRLCQAVSVFRNPLPGKRQHISIGDTCSNASLSCELVQEIVCIKSSICER
jgi:hypothetical protein